jgi:putative NIF3 family GTP cyclohydrolase 1 type 2
MKTLFDAPLSRRKFVAASMTAFAPAVFANSLKRQTITNAASSVLTIAEVIETIKKAIPRSPFTSTVDTVKSGDANKPVTGIVTTMFATIAVIRQAIALKANLIVAHEPTFYNHQDDTQWLEDDEVFKFKKKLLEDNNIVVWRFHDYWHATRPDGVLKGVLDKLQWSSYYDEKNPLLVIIPKISLGDAITHAKRKLGIQTLRFIGDRQQECSRILVIPGAPGGRMQISALQQFKPDLLICGELQEWETSEYIRDAIAAGEKRSLIVLGHALSEEPGMEYLVTWLQPRFPDLKIIHVPSESPFTFA